MLIKFLVVLGIALILLKVAGLIFWLWWTVLLPLMIAGVLGLALFLFIKNEIKESLDHK